MRVDVLLAFPLELLRVVRRRAVPSGRRPLVEDLGLLARRAEPQEIVFVVGIRTTALHEAALQQRSLIGVGDRRAFPDVARIRRQGVDAQPGCRAVGRDRLLRAVVAGVPDEAVVRRLRRVGRRPRVVVHARRNDGRRLAGRDEVVLLLLHVRADARVLGHERLAGAQPVVRLARIGDDQLAFDAAAGVELVDHQRNIQLVRDVDAAVAVHHADAGVRIGVEDAAGEAHEAALHLDAAHFEPVLNGVVEHRDVVAAGGARVLEAARVRRHRRPGQLEVREVAVGFEARAFRNTVGVPGVARQVPTARVFCRGDLAGEARRQVGIVIGDAALQDAVHVQRLRDDHDVVGGNDVAVGARRQCGRDLAAERCRHAVGARGAAVLHSEADRIADVALRLAVIFGRLLHRGPRPGDAGRAAADVEQRVLRGQDEVLARGDIQLAGDDVRARDDATRAEDRHVARHVLDVADDLDVGRAEQLPGWIARVDRQARVEIALDRDRRRTAVLARHDRAAESGDGRHVLAVEADDAARGVGDGDALEPQIRRTVVRDRDVDVARCLERALAAAGDRVSADPNRTRLCPDRLDRDVRDVERRNEELRAVRRGGAQAHRRHLRLDLLQLRHIAGRRRSVLGRVLRDQRDQPVALGHQVVGKRLDGRRCFDAANVLADLDERRFALGVALVDGQLLILHDADFDGAVDVHTKGLDVGDLAALLLFRHAAAEE